MLISVRLILSFLILIVPSLYGAGRKKSEPTTLVFPSFLHTMGIRKATKTHLMLYTGNKVKVNNPQGLVVVRLDSWDDPDEVDDDDEVTGYGVNSGANLIVYNRSMSSLGFYGINLAGEGKLKNPTAITANNRGDVYVVDTGNNRIVRLFNEKADLKYVKGIGGKGASPGKFNAPGGIAMDSHNMVYVADTNNHRIQILRPDDKLHLWFGDQGVDDGELWHPTGIAVTNGKERWSFYKDSFLVLVDLDGRRLQKFDLTGKFKKAIRLQDFGYQSGHLLYLALDYYSNIWVTDFTNHCIHKFDRNLNYLTSFGKKGSGKKEFIEPRGIAIHKRFGQVFIVERDAAQYYWIGADVFDFAAKYLNAERIVGLDFTLTEPAFLTLEVKKKGDKRRTLFERKKYFNGARTIYVNGEWRTSASRFIGDIAKKGVPAGEYEFKLKIEPTYSSFKYFSKEVETRIRVN